jgi:hypothetical protein
VKHTCNNRFVCNRCLDPFSSKERLQKYFNNGCDKFEPTRVILPEIKNNEIPYTIFKNYNRKFKAPAAIYMVILKH